MKRYTKADMENFERDEYGCLICPTGDYSKIRSFGAGCSFGAECSFGEECRFGKECRFGEDCKFGGACSFGDWCSFGAGCSFGAECSFGEECRFGNKCRVGEKCSFGWRCSFGEWCSFGNACGFSKWSSFGEKCCFGENCVFENGKVKNGTYFACDRIGSERRKTYFFRDGDGKMYVRAGCWFSSLDEFVERVKEAHGGTNYEKEYLMAVELAKIVLEGC